MDMVDVLVLEFLVAETPDDTRNRLKHGWCCRSEEKGERRKRRKQIWYRLGTLLYIRTLA